MKKYIKPNIDIENMVEEDMICTSPGGVQDNAGTLGNVFSSTDESYSKRIINFADYNDDDMAWDE